MDRHRAYARSMPLPGPSDPPGPPAPGRWPANPVIYEQNTYQFLDMNDMWSGLIKAAVFGLILALTGCVRGYYTTGGAEGVGRATTAAVVSASLIILLTDFFLTKMLF